MSHSVRSRLVSSNRSVSWRPYSKPSFRVAKKAVALRKKVSARRHKRIKVRWFERPSPNWSGKSGMPQINPHYRGPTRGQRLAFMALRLNALRRRRRRF